MSKRSNGEGNIRRRESGGWEARLSYVDPATGARRRVSFYGRTKADVRDKMREARDRLDAGAPPKDATITVADWLARWRATTLEASDRKPTTKALYSSLSRSHLDPAPFGAVRLDRLAPTDVEALLVALRDKGLAESTVRNVFAVLSQALDVAVRDRLIARNPAAAVKRPRVAATEAVHLDVAQVGDLLSAAKGMRYVDALRLIAATGLRRGEALGLSWTDIDLDDSVIRVRHTVASVDGKLSLSGVKTAKSKRTVPLSPATVAMLRGRRPALLRERLAAGDQYTENNLVFPTELGTLVDPRNLLREVETAAARCGFEGVGVHTLRHSAAVAWLEAGVHIRAVADLLGHSSVSITGDVYGHTSEPVSRSAVEGLSDALGF